MHLVVYNILTNTGNRVRVFEKYSGMAPEMCIFVKLFSLTALPFEFVV